MAIRKFLKLTALAGALLVAACGEQSSSDQNRKVRKGGAFVTEEVTQTGGFFYRLQAFYTVKETGEPITFDFVVACNVRTTNYSYTGPSFVAERYPEVMAKATRDGHAVMIKTPRICQQIELDRGYVPDDFVPFAIWFDDVDDLSFGWGYATEDAYDGPNAKIDYRPKDPGLRTAYISRATRAEWEAWRRRAAEEWVQIGALPGPWGYSDPQDEAGFAERDRVRALNGGKALGTYCDAMKRIPVDAQTVIEVESVAAANPAAYSTDSIVAYDVRFPEVVEAFVSISRRGMKEPIYGGYTYEQVYEAVEGTLLKPPALGSKLREPETIRKQGYRESYPLLSYVEPPYLDFLKTGYVKQILFGPEWVGLAACGFSSPRVELGEVRATLDPRLSESSVALTSKVYPVYLNDNILFENALPITRNTIDVPSFLERNGHIWRPQPNPGG